MRLSALAGPAFLCAALLGAAPPIAAQTQNPSDLRGELGRIRDATTLQARGDVAGAERVLREVLAGNPTSLSGLLILEQVLAVQGRARDLVPLVNELLRRDPGSTIGHQLLARTFAGLRQTAELEAAGAAWIAAMPRIETPYRELARLWLERQDFTRALRVLELGRERVGTPGAMALELGDVYLAAGDQDRAVQEWDRAIGAQGQGFLLVQRRLRARPDGGSAISPLLVRSLIAEPTSVHRRRAALQLALDAGLAGEAQRIAQPLLEALPAAEREAFLADVARRADGAALDRIGYWAYGELIRTAERGSERLLALRTRQAQLALAAGDTAGAAAAYHHLELATSPGSPQRRQAVAVRIRLGAHAGDVATTLTELRAFRAEFPDAPELDETAAAVAEALLDTGDLDGAETVVAGVRGPRSALVRGRSYLRRGDVGRSTAELLLAAPGLHGQEATRVIALAAVLTRISAGTGEHLGRAVARMREDAPVAIAELLERSRSLPAAERAAVLDFAAARADETGLSDLAEQARRALVADAPRSAVAPAALYWLAQRARGRLEQGEARVLFERLILEYPRSALVPQARRELDRITGRVPAPDSSKAGGS